MGGGTPEIVGFGSSVGHDDAYCEKNAKQEICQKYLQSQRIATENAQTDKPTWHGNQNLVEFGVEGTDDRSIRLTCEKGKMHALGPWDGKDAKSSSITVQAVGMKQRYPVEIFEAGDGSNYAAAVNGTSNLIVGLLAGTKIEVYRPDKMIIDGFGSEQLVKALLTSCSMQN